MATPVPPNSTNGLPSPGLPLTQTEPQAPILTAKAGQTVLTSVPSDSQGTNSTSGSPSLHGRANARTYTMVHVRDETGEVHTYCVWTELREKSTGSKPGKLLAYGGLENEAGVQKAAQDFLQAAATDPATKAFFTGSTDRKIDLKISNYLPSDGAVNNDVKIKLTKGRNNFKEVTMENANLRKPILALAQAMDSVKSHVDMNGKPWHPAQLVEATDGTANNNKSSGPTTDLELNTTLSPKQIINHLRNIQVNGEKDITLMDKTTWDNLSETKIADKTPCFIPVGNNLTDSEEPLTFLYKDGNTLHYFNTNGKPTTLEETRRASVDQFASSLRGKVDFENQGQFAEHTKLKNFMDNNNITEFKPWRKLPTNMKPGVAALHWFQELCKGNAEFPPAKLQNNETITVPGKEFNSGAAGQTHVTATQPDAKEPAQSSSAEDVPATKALAGPTTEETAARLKAEALKTAFQTAAANNKEIKTDYSKAMEKPENQDIWFNALNQTLHKVCMNPKQPYPKDVVIGSWGNSMVQPSPNTYSIIDRMATSNSCLQEINNNANLPLVREQLRVVAENPILKQLLEAPPQDVVHAGNAATTPGQPANQHQALIDETAVAKADLDSKTTFHADLVKKLPDHSPANKLEETQLAQSRTADDARKQAAAKYGELALRLSKAQEAAS